MAIQCAAVLLDYFIVGWLFHCWLVVSLSWPKWLLWGSFLYIEKGHALLLQGQHADEKRKLLHFPLCSYHGAHFWLHLWILVEVHMCVFFFWLPYSKRAVAYQSSILFGWLLLCFFKLSLTSIIIVDRSFNVGSFLMIHSWNTLCVYDESNTCSVNNVAVSAREVFFLRLVVWHNAVPTFWVV